MSSPELSRIERRIAEYQRELSNPVNPVIETEVLDLPVLNVENPTGDALGFRTALQQCGITLDYVGRDGLWLSGRFERQIYPIFKIINLVNGQPGEFHGYYIGEVFNGPVHPLALIPREDVLEHLKG